ncbi:MAG: ParB/RepB/Spo0J family partition protein [Candidatus Omnitrophica bacterium]|nr:ParB/RepB/Spo0J family partition protein [Candidatus Omnitrophota bacterium]
MAKKLGKGIGALIPNDKTDGKEKLSMIRVIDIKPNKLQPRTDFLEDKLEELKQSIREKGIIQPVLVRKVEDQYELIAGERRWRAAKSLKMEEIPAIIKKDIDDVSSLELALIENIQREDFNPIEEARAYEELVNDHKYTLDKIGQFVGKDKTTISNSLRLLNLPAEIITMVKDGKLSVGHAKVILSIPSDQKKLSIANTVAEQGFSVRQLEQIIKSKCEVKTKHKKDIDPEVQRIEEELQHTLGTKVTIHSGQKRGRIEIQYYSNDDLQRLLGLIMPNNNEI